MHRRTTGYVIIWSRGPATPAGLAVISSQHSSSPTRARLYQLVSLALQTFVYVTSGIIIWSFALNGALSETTDLDGGAGTDADRFVNAQAVMFEC